MSVASQIHMLKSSAPTWWYLKVGTLGRDYGECSPHEWDYHPFKRDPGDLPCSLHSMKTLKALIQTAPMNQETGPPETPNLLAP